MGFLPSERVLALFWDFFILINIPYLLAMARPRPEYTEFLEMLNPTGTDLRTAIWSHFFPDGSGTRNPVTFEFRVSLSVLFPGLGLVD